MTATLAQTTHRGLAPDGVTPTDHYGIQGLCRAPECQASGAIGLALTIQQPWADAIVQTPRAGRTRKGTENRTWPIPAKYLGMRILIHAGKQDDKRAVLVRSSSWLDQRGVILGTARITRCHQANTKGPLCCAPWGFPSEHGHTVWHWDLEDVWALPMPIGDVRGAQKLWRPTQGLVAAVREQEAW